jgi:hypothetical protein
MCFAADNIPQVMRFLVSNLPDDSEEVAVGPPRRHELAVEVLKLLTPCLGLILFIAGLSSKYPWLSKPWVLNALIALGVLVLVWFAKPRLTLWLRRFQDTKGARRFIAEYDARLRELVEQFAVFTSNSDNRSLICILRSVYSHNMQLAEQIIVGDYLGSWLYCYREQLNFPATSLRQFLSQCRTFSYIVQEFNRNYVLRAQRELAVKSPLAEDSTAKLEEFREEYAAFLRAVESWAKGISNYLQAGGMIDNPSLWKLAPTNSFERAKSFARTKP